MTPANEFARAGTRRTNGHARMPVLLDRRIPRKPTMSKLDRLYSAFGSNPPPLTKRASAPASTVSQEALVALVVKAAQPMIDALTGEQSEIRKRIEDLQDRRPPAQIILEK